MPLFAHYPARPEGIVASSEALLAASRRTSGVAGLVEARTRAAAGETAGGLTGPALELADPINADATKISVASGVAGGALGLFAGAVTTYNTGVDRLNEIYERAKVLDFFARPTGADATGPDGVPLTDDERSAAYDSRVSSAQSALEYVLGLRQAALMGDLDDAAYGTASVLDGADDPESMVPTLLFSWFGGGDSDDDDDDGGLLSDVGGFFSGGVDAVTGLGEEVWDRGSTFAVYSWDTGVRRLTHPGQTLWDTVTGTTILEDISAAEGILGEDGEIVRDGEYCGDDAACLTGVSVPDGAGAITTGHTIRFGDENEPPPALVAHEVQHVYDIEDVGALGFYGSYLADYLAGRAMGESHDEAYENVLWEQRAYDVGDNYPERKPQGIIDDLLNRLF